MTGNSDDDTRFGGNRAANLRGIDGSDTLARGNLFASEKSFDQLRTLRNGGIPSGLRSGMLTQDIADKLDSDAGDTLAISCPASETFEAYGTTAAEAVIVADYNAKDESLAVLYDRNGAIPAITVKEANTGVFTVLADGIPVAVVASAEAAITAADVLLLERNADGSPPAGL